MTRAQAILATILAASAGEAQAQDATTNALRDAARAQEQQADSLRRLESLEKDRARWADRDRRNAERDARSMRRFDR